MNPCLVPMRSLDCDCIVLKHITNTTAELSVTGSSKCRQFLLRHLNGTCCVGAEAAHSSSSITLSGPGHGSHQSVHSSTSDHVPLSVGLRQSSDPSSAAVAHADTDFQDVPISPTASEGYVKIVQQ